MLEAVSDDEREQIQDQLFLHDEMFAQMRLLEDQLTDEYLYEQLGSEDRRRFETYFLATPQRRERLKLAQALRQYAVEQKLPRLARPPRFEWI